MPRKRETKYKGKHNFYIYIYLYIYICIYIYLIKHIRFWKCLPHICIRRLKFILILILRMRSIFTSSSIFKIPPKTLVGPTAHSNVSHKFCLSPPLSTSFLVKALNTLQTILTDSPLSLGFKNWRERESGYGGGGGHEWYGSLSRGGWHMG